MSVTSFQDLPLADRDRAWDGDAAEKRVREWAGATDEPNEKYRHAHILEALIAGDEGGALAGMAHHLARTALRVLTDCAPDYVPRAVPRGVMAAAAVMQGSRGGVDLPDQDRGRVRSHLEKYYAKMGEDAPWERDD